MKLLFLVLMAVCLIGFSYGQEHRLWIEEYSADDAGTDDSNQFNMTDDAEEWGKFDGLMAITLDVDTLVADQGGNDSLYFVTMYKISGTWFTGDTIHWDRLNTANYGIDDPIIDTNIELVIAQTYQDSILVWRNDPTSTTLPEAYPFWQEFGVRMLHGDSIDVKLDVRLGRH